MTFTEHEIKFLIKQWRENANVKPLEGSARRCATQQAAMMLLLLAGVGRDGKVFYRKENGKKVIIDS